MTLADEKLTQYLVMMCALSCLVLCYVDVNFCHGDGVGLVVDVDLMA